jgi:hypothetical protein
MLAKDAATSMLGVTSTKIPNPFPSTHRRNTISRLLVPKTVDVSGIQPNGFWSANWLNTARHPVNQDFINEMVRRILSDQVWLVFFRCSFTLNVSRKILVQWMSSSTLQDRISGHCAFTTRPTTPPNDSCLASTKVIATEFGRGTNVLRISAHEIVFLHRNRFTT